jgi:hypothetical protein
VELAAPGLDARTLYREGPRALGRDRWPAFLKSFNDLVRAHPELAALDLHIPAITKAVAYWSTDGNPVAIVHDQQNLLTEQRLLLLKDMLGSSLGPWRRRTRGAVEVLCRPRLELGRRAKLGGPATSVTRLTRRRMLVYEYT